MASKFSFNDRPSVLHLKEIKGRDGLNVIQTIGANDYRTFGMYLLGDINGQKIDLIEKEKATIQGIVEGIIDDWLKQGNSSTPTYRHLIDCIRKSGIGAFAEEIEAMAEKEIDFRAPPTHGTKRHVATDGNEATEELIDLEKPKFSIDNEQAKPMAISQEEYEIVKSFTEKVRIVIQTCNDAEYYAVLEMLEPPQIENPKFEKPVKYFHKELRIVVGTFAGIAAAIVETDQGIESKQGLEAAVEVFRSAKFLLGLGICYGIKENSAEKDLKFADVLVSNEIGISTRPKLGSKGLNPRESFEKISKLMKNLFCVRPNWDGIVVSDEPTQRTAMVYVGRLLSAPILMNDSTRLGLIKEKWREYLGGEMEGWVQMEIPGVASIIIKGIADFADGKKNDKWQLTAAKAAVNYAHYRLKQFGYIDFDQL